MNQYARDKPEKLRDIWNYYDFGEQFNCQQKPDQYSIVETNTEFFNGNQWIHLPDNDAMRRLPKPVFNIIKRVTSLFVASLTSSGTTISFSPLLSQGDGDAAKIATDEVRNLLEKLKMDYRIRDALFDGAITGDYCAHFFWNPDAKPYGGAFGECRGEIEMEMIDGINVMLQLLIRRIKQNVTPVNRWEKKLAALPANLQVQVGKLPSKARNALMGMR